MACCDDDEDFDFGANLGNVDDGLISLLNHSDYTYAEMKQEIPTGRPFQIRRKRPALFITPEDS